MVETITPVVHGGRTVRFWLSAAFHVVGATIAAALLGALLGVVGALLGAPWGTPGAIVVAVIAAAYFAREAIGVPIPIPQRKRQVPEWWRSFFTPPGAAFLYGLGLGVGFLTYLSFGTFVVVASASLAAGEPALGALVCAPFGVARGVVVVGASLENATAIATGPLPRVANAGAVGAVLVAVLITSL